MPDTIQSVLKSAQLRLAGVSDTPRLDAELLLASVIKRPRSYLWAWPEAEIDSGIQQNFEALLNRREQGTPVAHLLGQREFWSLNLKITPDTLIPRPETELLVETALQYLPTNRPGKVLDLGTGSGAIALALAQERPSYRFLAIDRSTAALAVAKENALRHHVHNLEFLASDWFSALCHTSFSMIVANPPYISEDDPHLHQGDVRFEPRTALTAGKDGLDAIRHIISTAPNYLADGAWLLVEHGYDQATAINSLLQQAGFRQIKDLEDPAGQARLAIGQVK